MYSIINSLPVSVYLQACSSELKDQEMSVHNHHNHHLLVSASQQEKPHKKTTMLAVRFLAYLSCRNRWRTFLCWRHETFARRDPVDGESLFTNILTRVHQPPESKYTCTRDSAHNSCKNNFRWEVMAGRMHLKTPQSSQSRTQAFAFQCLSLAVPVWERSVKHMHVGGAYGGMAHSWITASRYIKSYQMVVVECHSVQKLQSFTITLLQMFDLFFTGSQVATIL